MSAATPDGISEFLVAATPPAWVEAAAARLPELLNDHANCELKAASTAMAIIYRYSERGRLCTSLSRLAREELRHYEQVRQLMDREGIAFQRVSASRYARGLLTELRPSEPERLLDSLLIGALIEARSCERFAVLAPRLHEPLRGFYTGLLRSEARHFENYLSFAAELADEVSVALRLDELKAVENKLVLSPDPQFRFHSGAPEI